MEKVLLALGHQHLETFLERKLSKEFMFVGTTVYREGVIRAIGQKNPDIVILRETLEGKENILSLVYDIKMKFENVRIVFIGGKREPGDALLATLVNYGVYDIIYGEKVQANSIISLVRKPNEYKNVQHLQPAPVFNESSNELLFQAPTAIIQKQEIVKEIYIDTSSKQPIVEAKEETKPEKEPVSKVEPLVVVEKTIELEKKIEVEQEEIVESVEIIEESLPIPAPALVKEEAKVEEQVKSEPKDEVKKSKESEKKGLLDKFKSKQNNVPLTQTAITGTKQKIITFAGSKSGVGNSSVAFNTALTLAQQGLKTIYLEFNDRTPSVQYWYELGYPEDGIDTALVALETNQFDLVEKAIIKSSELKKKESLMKKNYRKFPNTLDFMFFSNRFLNRESRDNLSVDLELSKELYLYLLFQKEYDFIILDVPSDIHNLATINSMIYSNKIFLTLTQDVATIGYSIYNLNELSKRGVNLEKKLHYIVNKFEASKEFSMKELEDWIEPENPITTVPILNKSFINANFLGLPVGLYSKKEGLQPALQKIEKLIVK